MNQPIWTGPWVMVIQEDVFGVGLRAEAIQLQLEYAGDYPARGYS